jgi:hypothetical protein
MQYSKDNNFQSNVQPDSTQAAQTTRERNLANQVKSATKSDSPPADDKEWPGVETEPVKDSEQFPTGVFPGKIGYYIEQLSGQNAPEDFIGCSILYAAATAAGNGYHISWPYFQVPVIYIGLVGTSGTGKSHPLRKVIKPLHDKNKELHQEYERDCEQYRGSEETEKKPIRKKRLVQDITVEKLAEDSYYNPKGLGLYKPELKEWVQQFNRYNNSGEDTFWVNNFDLEPIDQSRKQSQSYYIESPAISVGGTIQRNTLKALAGGDKADSGFFDRVIFSVPEGLKAPRHSKHQDTNKKVEDDWSYHLKECIDKESEKRFDSGTTQVPWEDAAQDEWLAWDNRVADRVDASDNNITNQMLSKLRTYSLRLTLLLAILDDYKNPRINAGHVQGGCKLAVYFECHGHKARELAGIAETSYSTLIRELYKLNNGNNKIARVLGLGKGYVSEVINGKK